MSGILLAFIYAALFIVLIKKHSFFQTEGISRNTFIGAFLLKISAGTILWFVYTHIYSERSNVDIFKYFDDGKVIYNALFIHPVDYLKMLVGINDPALQHYLENTGHWKRVFNQGLYNDNRTVIRFNALVDIFSFGYYHVHTVMMCFVSFLGLTGLYKSFVPFLSNKKKELFIIIFLIPSVLFWGSGVLKEGLIQRCNDGQLSARQACY